VKLYVQYVCIESLFSWSHCHHWTTNRSISKNGKKKKDLFTLSKSNTHIRDQLCKSTQGQWCLLLCYTDESMGF